MGAVFVARGLTKTYHVGRTEVHALRGIDFEIRQGEFVVLLGASGSGKSTLFNILGGLDMPSSGKVRFLGQDLSQAKISTLTEYRRAQVGLIFQSYNLIPCLTASENVSLAANMVEHPIPPREVLEWVGLSARANHFPAQLSGGEQQRVAIARALTKRPKILLCDEPTGALDDQTGKTVMGIIEKANARLGTTALVITHNGEMSKIADRVIRLKDGRIVEEPKLRKRFKRGARRSA